MVTTKTSAPFIILQKLAMASIVVSFNIFNARNSVILVIDRPFT